jgi:hypothetical protein
MVVLTENLDWNISMMEPAQDRNRHYIADRFAGGGTVVRLCTTISGEVFGDGRKASVVGRRLAGEPMAELCREFGISRKTGYKASHTSSQKGEKV